MPFTATITASDLFGFDTEQQESLRKIFDLVEQAAVLGLSSYSVTNTEFFGFETEQQEALRDSLTWVYFFKSAPPGLLTSNCFNLAQRNALQNTFAKFATALAAIDAGATLRNFITANYNQPNPHNQSVMPSPPVVTNEGTSLPGGMAVNATITVPTQDTSGIRLLGGTLFSAGGNLRVYSAVVGATGGNGGLNDGKECAGWRADFDANAAVVVIRVQPTTAGYRFIVNGRYVSLTPSQTVGTTGTTSEYFKLDFTSVGGKALRRISIEGDRACGLNQVWVAAGDTVTRPSDTPKRLAFVGDSFTFGSAAPQLADNYAWVSADMLGIRHSLNSGSGGTGYVTTAGASVKLSDRLSDINTKGPHDIIVVAMGINDIGQNPLTITQEVKTCLNSLRINNPSAKIFVIGPWDANAPAAPVTGYSAVKTAIQNGLLAEYAVTFLDPQGIVYSKADAVHPDVPGHKTLGDWLALQIKTALGA